LTCGPSLPISFWPVLAHHLFPFRSVEGSAPRDLFLRSECYNGSFSRSFSLPPATLIVSIPLFPPSPLAEKGPKTPPSPECLSLPCTQPMLSPILPVHRLNAGTQSCRLLHLCSLPLCPSLHWKGQVPPLTAFLKLPPPPALRPPP